MALFPFLKRRQAADAPATPAEQVQRARTRARQRLIGAVVLLGVGIVGFPILFETQPRPIPVDVKIEIPRKDAVPPLVPPTSAQDRASTDGRTAASGPAVAALEAAASAVASKAPIGEAPAEPTADASRPAPAAPAAAATASAPAVSTASAPAAPGGVSERPVAGSPPRAAAAASAPAPTGAPAAAESVPRFVVQVGAFADRTAAQRTRERVEKLGLKTYTQVVETGDGPRTRVRVGPFASRDEADRAAARLKTAGLTAAVLTL